MNCTNPLIFYKQKHEGKKILKVNGVGESHQGMDPKTLDSMPMTTTSTDPRVFENTLSIKAKVGGQEMKKMVEKREKATNDKTKSFHETSLCISFLLDAFKVAGFCKKGYLPKVDKSV